MSYKIDVIEVIMQHFSFDEITKLMDELADRVYRSYPNKTERYVNKFRFIVRRKEVDEQ